MSTSSDPVQMLIDAGAIPASPYPPASRYRGVPLATLTRADGTLIAYGQRRLIPPRREIATAALHVVQGGARPELIAHAAYDEPLMYWRIADGNAVIDPFELCAEIGARIALPVPPTGA